MMKSVPIPQRATGVQAHTQRAIIDAAVRCLAEDFTAPLADIAKKAGVGRTTLHRYFNERNDLLAVISATAVAQSSEATQRARLAEGPALDAIGRFCEEHFEMGEILALVLDQPQLSDTVDWDNEGPKEALLELICRGQAEGTIDPKLQPEWAHQVIWTLLYGVLHYQPVDGASRNGALNLCLSSLRRALEPPA
ncbi:MAG TPA: TetR/AcrR family transcriptional regulator [Baekduia sp.]|nr:TetR/AcrR family transcriptional regulator [Baekduia sp.]